jgi:hypothetical protein
MFLHFFLLLQVALCAVNNDVSQIIDASSSIVKYSAEIKASLVENEYEIFMSAKWAEHLSFFSVTSKGKPLSVLPPIRYMRVYF